jgi:uncharacterized surface protein with fasciclin (FAS1) repeats
MKRRYVKVLAAVFAVSLVAGACGDDDDAADATSTEAATDATTTTAASGAGDENAAADIVDTAIAAGDFKTLVAAVQAAGLEETLRGEGPFTVFAPTDAAFGALPAGTVDTLLEDPTGDLAAILTYHVVSGAVMAKDVVALDAKPVTTVNGATFTVDVEGDAVTLTDAAGATVAVTATDVQASNGVIHVIDAVLMPS